MTSGITFLHHYTFLVCSSLGYNFGCNLCWRTTGLPKSDVLYFDMDNDAWLCVRPSGTEPKIKFYCGVKGTSFEDADAKMTKLKNELTALVK